MNIHLQINKNSTCPVKFDGYLHPSYGYQLLHLFSIMFHTNPGQHLSTPVPSLLQRFSNDDIITLILCIISCIMTLIKLVLVYIVIIHDSEPFLNIPHDETLLTIPYNQ